VSSTLPSHPLPAFLAALLTGAALVAACGGSPSAPSAAVSPEPTAGGANPSTSIGGSAQATALASAPVASPSAPAPDAKSFWARATAALKATGRLRVSVVRPDALELRYEPGASASVVGGVITTICIRSAWYDVQGHRASQIRGKWSCGSAALVAAFRKTGQPLEAYNSTLPVYTSIGETVTVQTKTWRWTFTALSRDLGGTVTTSVVLDAVTGRLLSAQRTDPRGTTQYGFSYTSIFLPIALP